MKSPARKSSASRAASFTPLQGQYLSFIFTYEGIHGCAPAETDLQRHFGVTPPSVHQMIVTLERKGLIARVPGVGRSISLRVPPAELPPLERLPKSATNRSTSQRSAIRSRKAADRAGRTTHTLPSSGRTQLAKDDRDMEYVDSPMMSQRLWSGEAISARIAGRYGDYRTRVRLTQALEGACTCPSDVRPCEHVRALRVTWETNPESFFDVAAFLRTLGSVEKAELIETIGEIVLAFPQTLGFFGFAGFDENEENADDQYDNDESAN